MTTAIQSKKKDIIRLGLEKLVDAPSRWLTHGAIGFGGKDHTLWYDLKKSQDQPKDREEGALDGVYRLADPLSGLAGLLMDEKKISVAKNVACGVLSLGALYAGYYTLAATGAGLLGLTLWTKLRGQPLYGQHNQHVLKNHNGTYIRAQYGTVAAGVAALAVGAAYLGLPILTTLGVYAVGASLISNGLYGLLKRGAKATGNGIKGLMGRKTPKRKIRSEYRDPHMDAAADKLGESIDNTTGQSGDHYDEGHRNIPRSDYSDLLYTPLPIGREENGSPQEPNSDSENYGRQPRPIPQQNRESGDQKIDHSGQQSPVGSQESDKPINFRTARRPDYDDDKY